MTTYSFLKKGPRGNLQLHAPTNKKFLRFYANESEHNVPNSTILNFNWGFHREDGPAIEYMDGTGEWWINGNRIV